MVETLDEDARFDVMASFSPLLIGAMVETHCHPRFEVFHCSFSPLLIGAMVETRLRPEPRIRENQLSVPF